MRNAAAAIAALILAACAAEQTPPRERLTFSKVERHYEFDGKRAAEGHVFVTVHLVEDPAREEDRDWIRSVMEDWDGRKYQARHSNVSKSRSSRNGFFGRSGMTARPDRIWVTFEVPQAARLRGLTVPDPIALDPEKPVRVSRGMPAPRVVHQVEPWYPEPARRHRLDGLVKLDVLVARDGTVAGAKLVHGPRVLGDAAAEAVRQWRYEPLVVDGKAVPALVQVSIHFRLDS